MTDTANIKTDQVPRRLIAVQGPTQLLNVIAILRYQQKCENYPDCEDHLILGGMAVQNNDFDDLSTTCREIAEFWNFRSIVNLDESALLDDSKRSFDNTVSKVRNIFGISLFDCVYVCRNWQLFNELVLNAFPEAKNICYGDGFGTIDLKHGSDDNRAYSPEGYRRIQEAYLFCPIQEDPARNSLNLVSRLVQPPNSILIETIREIAESLHKFKRYCIDLTRNNPGSSTIILTSNYTEACILKYSRYRLVTMLWINRILANLTNNRVLIPINKYPRKEISMYLEQIHRCDLGNLTIWIKGHPRQTLEQSAFLAKELRNMGHKVVEILDYRNYPIELYACFLDYQIVLALGSSSATSLKIMKPEAFIRPLIDRDIREKYFRKEMLDLTGPDFSYYYQLESTTGKKILAMNEHITKKHSPAQQQESE